MNDMIVKSVGFMGDTVMAAKDQTGNERKKIQDDLVLSQGVKFHPLGTGNANKEVLCLQLDYIRPAITSRVLCGKICA